ncbi:MAG: hypothetical protein ACK5SM_05685, partial [Sphingomonadales bacterium]
SFKGSRQVRAIVDFAVGGLLPCINAMVAEYASPKARTFSVAFSQAGFSTDAHAIRSYHRDLFTKTETSSL